MYIIGGNLVCYSKTSDDKLLAHPHVLSPAHYLQHLSLIPRQRKPAYNAFDERFCIFDLLSITYLQ